MEPSDAEKSFLSLALLYPLYFPRLFIHAAINTLFMYRLADFQ